MITAIRNEVLPKVSTFSVNSCSFISRFTKGYVQERFTYKNIEYLGAILMQALLYKSLRNCLTFFFRNLIYCFSEDFDKTLAIFYKAVQILKKDLVRLQKLIN